MFLYSNSAANKSFLITEKHTNLITKLLLRGSADNPLLTALRLVFSMNLDATHLSWPTGSVLWRSCWQFLFAIKRFH